MTKGGGMSSTKEVRSHLGALREIQRWSDRTPGATAPNMCIAASRFFIAKMSGLAPAAAHLNNFLGSALAPRMGLAEHKALWGSPSHAHDREQVARFNREVVPALLKWGGLRAGANVRLVVERGGSPHTGDRLLGQGVPLIAGVHLRHGRAVQGINSHDVSLVRDGNNNTWLVDSWGSETGSSVRGLPARVAFSFALPMQVELSSGTAVLPGRNLTLCWFEQDGAPLPNAITL